MVGLLNRRGAAWSNAPRLGPRGDTSVTDPERWILLDEQSYQKRRRPTCSKFTPCAPRRGPDNRDGSCYRNPCACHFTGSVLIVEIDVVGPDNRPSCLRLPFH